MKNKWLYIFIGIVVILIGLIFFLKDDVQKEYDSYLIELNYNELINKIDNKDNFILYVKQTNCTHCQAFTPEFQKVLTKYKVKAYYINLTNLSKEDNISLHDLTGVEGTPTTYFFENGEKMSTTIEGNKKPDVIISKLRTMGYIK